MKLATTLVLLLIWTNLSAQDSLSSGVVELPGNYAASVNKKIEGLDDQLSKNTEKYLHSLQKQEEKILKQLSKIDSSAAATMLNNAKETYEQLNKKLQTTNQKLDKALSGQYMPYLDSLQGSLGFLKRCQKHCLQNKGSAGQTARL